MLIRIHLNHYILIDEIIEKKKNKVRIVKRKGIGTSFDCLVQIWNCKR